MHGIGSRRLAHTLNPTTIVFACLLSNGKRVANFSVVFGGFQLLGKTLNIFLENNEVKVRGWVVV